MYDGIEIMVLLYLLHECQSEIALHIVLDVHYIVHVHGYELDRQSAQCLIIVILNGENEDNTGFKIVSSLWQSHHDRAY